MTPVILTDTSSLNVGRAKENQQEKFSEFEKEASSPTSGYLLKRTESRDNRYLIY